MDYPCRFTVWSQYLHDYNGIVKSDRDRKDYQLDEMELVKLFTLLSKEGYKETITLARDDTWMNVFWDDWHGWRVITSDIRGRE